MIRNLIKKLINPFRYAPLHGRSPDSIDIIIDVFWTDANLNIWTDASGNPWTIQ
jgi:hypothetical protein